jgi:hypothetical protein
MFKTVLSRSLSRGIFLSSVEYLSTSNGMYVPTYHEPCKADIEQLDDFISHSQRLFVITGAGISTESGIPDYRSEGVGLYARTSNRPMYVVTYQ